MYAEHSCVKANRVNPRFVDHKGKQVWAVKMSFPWVDNCGKKCEEKTAKYGPLRWELKRQYPSYDIEQSNTVNDVLAAPTKHLPRRQMTMKIKLADQLTESMKEGVFTLRNLPAIVGNFFTALPQDWRGSPAINLDVKRLPVGRSIGLYPRPSLVHYLPTVPLRWPNTVFSIQVLINII